MAIAKSSERVVIHTSRESNERIRERTAKRIARLASEGQEAVERRFEQLETEWDIERVLELQSSALSLAGLLLAGARRQKRWLLLPAAVQGFMLQHAIEGWCPPIPALRWLGFRTQREIEEERQALLELEII